MSQNPFRYFKTIPRSHHSQLDDFARRLEVAKLMVRHEKTLAYHFTLKFTRQCRMERCYRSASTILCSLLSRKDLTATIGQLERDEKVVIETFPGYSVHEFWQVAIGFHRLNRRFLKSVFGTICLKNS